VNMPHSALPNPAPARGRGRLTDVVIKALTDRLDRHVYRPGERLPSEQELCAEFGVSRTVVREAVASIRLTGRLFSKPGIGVHVAVERAEGVTLTPGTLAGNRAALHIMELRMGIEVEAAGLAAERRTPRDLADIARAFDDFNSTGHDSTAAARADFAFHLAIARAANNPHFPQLLESAIKDVMLDLRLKRGGKADHERRDYEQRASREHSAIMFAIMRSDAGAARAAMFGHLGDSIQRYRQALLSQT